MSLKATVAARPNFHGRQAWAAQVWRGDALAFEFVMDSESAAWERAHQAFRQMTLQEEGMLRD